MSSLAKATAAQSSPTIEAEFKADLVGLIPYLRAFAVTLCGRELSEDIAQEALAKAWKARGSYQHGTNLKAWLFTILRNEYMSHRRRAWRQVAWDDDAAARIPTPADKQGWASELSDVERALYRLPASFREAMILVAVAGFSYEEAARIVQVPVGTMKSRVGRARASLTAMLETNESLPQRKASPEGSALDHFVAQIPLAAAASGNVPEASRATVLISVDTHRTGQRTNG